MQKKSVLNFKNLVIVATFVSYFKYEVTESSVTIKEGEADFPAVTFCNLAPFDFKKRIFHEFLTSYVQDFNTSLDITIAEDASAIDEVEKVLSILRAQVFSTKVKGNLNDSFIESLGFRKRNMLVSCFYGGKKCGDEDFTWFHDYNYGNCYTFNKNK